jgi:hypothetical protein
MCTMSTGKKLYASTLILCCYGYQTGDNSELQTVILRSMTVPAVHLINIVLDVDESLSEIGKF